MSRLSCKYFFFFSSRRRHTRWPRDWSSDVCSSDLDRPEAPRARWQRAAALRRAAAVGRRVDRPAARPDLALPYSRSRTAATGRRERLGARRRRALAELVRHLPRPRPALELLGRARAPVLARRADRSRPAGSARASAADRTDRPLHLVPAGELHRALLARAPQPRVGRARTAPGLVPNL